LSGGSAPNAPDSGIKKGGNISIRARSLFVSDGSVLATTTIRQATNRNAAERTNAGDININLLDNLFVSGGAQLRSDTYAQGDAGNISVHAAGDIVFDGVAVVNNAFTPSGVSSSVSFDSKLGRGIGNAGSVTITGRSLSLINGAALISGTSGLGDANDIMIDVSGAIRVAGFDRSSGFFSQINSAVDSGVVGKGGNITLKAASASLENLARLSTVTAGMAGEKRADAGNIALTVGGDFSVTGGAQLRSDTFGQGNAGNIKIQTGGSATFDGIAVSNGSPVLVNRIPFVSGISSSVGSDATNQLTGEGNAGNIYLIVEKNLFVTNGAQLTSITTGQGNAGNIKIQTSGSVTVDGFAVANNYPVLVDGSPFLSGISSGVTGTGRGGSIQVKADSLSIEPI